MISNHYTQADDDVLKKHHKIITWYDVVCVVVLLYWYTVWFYRSQSYYVHLNNPRANSDSRF